jgi:hypothetical protein
MMVADDGDDTVVEQWLYDHPLVGRRRTEQPAKQEIDVAIMQILVLRCCEQCLIDADNDARMQPRYFLDHERKYPGGHRFRTADTELSHGSIGKKLKFLNALPELVKDRQSAPRQACP